MCKGMFLSVTPSPFQSRPERELFMVSSMKQENLNVCQSCTRELGSAAVLCLLHSSDCLPLSFGSFLTPLLSHTLFYCVPPRASVPVDVIFSDVLLLFTSISWFSFQLYLKVCLACALGYGKVAPLSVLKTSDFPKDCF